MARLVAHHANYHCSATLRYSSCIVLAVSVLLIGSLFRENFYLTGIVANPIINQTKPHHNAVIVRNQTTTRTTQAAAAAHVSKHNKDDDKDKDDDNDERPVKTNKPSKPPTQKPSISTRTTTTRDQDKTTTSANNDPKADSSSSSNDSVVDNNDNDNNNDNNNDEQDEDARPRGLRLAMMGDSITRYQYLSLAYFLKNGVWFDPNQTDPHLVHEGTYGETYQEFYEKNWGMLRPYERCDCYRPMGDFFALVENITENRYFYEPTRNNTLVYIEAFGHYHHPHGQVEPHQAFQNLHRFRYNFTAYNQSYTVWNTSEWDWVVDHHLAQLRPPPTHVVLNADLWYHEFDKKPKRRNRLKRSLQRNGMVSVWKTMTHNYWHDHTTANVTDPLMCQLLDACLNLTWTQRINMTQYQYDGIHYVEPIYRLFNEQMLSEIVNHTWPTRYQPLDRTDFFA